MRGITNPPNPGIPYGIGELIFSHDALMRFAGALRLAVTGKPFDHLDRKVLVNIDFQSDRLGLAPGLHLAVEFTSAEAYRIGLVQEASTRRCRQHPPKVVAKSVGEELGRQIP